MERSPLNNVSIARVTLQFASPEAIGVFVDDRWIASRGLTTEGRLVRVIEDYRQHDFATALSSIGGLLAVLQGLHILCFGRPLFWGMLGMSFLYASPWSITDNSDR
jgi:hypothetical protein